MNEFLVNIKKLLELHGEDCSYIKVTQGTYTAGAVVNTETTSVIRCYRKHIRATQYSYPSLIGKDAILVYIAGDALVNLPKANDKISFSGVVYKVDAVQEHRVLGQLTMYRISCYKS